MIKCYYLRYCDKFVEYNCIIIIIFIQSYIRHDKSYKSITPYHFTLQLSITLNWTILYGKVRHSSEMYRSHTHRCHSLPSHFRVHTFHIAVNKCVVFCISRHFILWAFTWFRMPSADALESNKRRDFVAGVRMVVWCMWSCGLLRRVPPPPDHQPHQLWSLRRTPNTTIARSFTVFAKSVSSSRAELISWENPLVSSVRACSSTR